MDDETLNAIAALLEKQRGEIVDQALEVLRTEMHSAFNTQRMDLQRHEQALLSRISQLNLSPATEPVLPHPQPRDAAEESRPAQPRLHQ